MAATDKNTKNKEIKIDWSVSDWSKCSHTCGKNGTQIRKVECVAINGDKEQTIPKQICSDAGFKVFILQSTVGQKIKKVQAKKNS